MVELLGHQPDDSLGSWEDTARNAALQLKTAVRDFPYIEARGLLCHELMHLLGGSIEFVETPWKNPVLRALEFFIPIAPICRWMPPRNSLLTQVGYHGDQETVVYRFIPEEGSTVVFFVNYKPEPPGGRYIRPLFNVPQLDLHRFLRPPFEKENREAQLNQLLRRGMTQTFGPLPMTKGAADYLSELNAVVCRAMWEEFSGK